MKETQRSSLRRIHFSLAALSLVLGTLETASASTQKVPPATVAASAETTEPSKPTSSSDEPSFTLENSLTLRDPFRRPRSRMATEADEGGNIPELFRYELDKFKLIGVITGPKKQKVLVTTPDGKMHVLTERDQLGARHGRITRIAPGMMKVEEKVVNLLGQEESVETVIEIRKDEKETVRE